MLVQYKTIAGQDIVKKTTLDLIINGNSIRHEKLQTLFELSNDEIDISTIQISLYGTRIKKAN